MYDTKQPGCFKSALFSPGKRNPSHRPQNHSCSFMHLDSIYQLERLHVLPCTLAEPLEERISATPWLSLPPLLNLSGRTLRWRDCEKGSGGMDYLSQTESCLFILMSSCDLRETAENMDSLLFITPGLDLTHPDTGAFRTMIALFFEWPSTVK